MTEEYHSLIVRQLKKAGFDFEEVKTNPKLNSLVAMVSRAYQQSDENRNMTDHSLRKSSEEMRKVIMEQDSSKKALEKLNEELTQFTYRTSHDLKAPLLTIISLTQLMIEDLKNNNLEEVERNINRIDSLSTRLEVLVTDMLNLTKADFNTGDKELFNFQDEIQNIQASLVHFIEQNPTTVIFEDHQKGSLKTEAIRLRQVLENLISNGIKYSNRSHKNCYVKIIVTDNETETTIKVEDNGLGIPAENHNEVFTMFKRFHASKIGSGLGLSLVKKHIEAMKGSISFISSSKGTQFTIILPKN